MRGEGTGRARLEGGGQGGQMGPGEGALPKEGQVCNMVWCVYLEHQIGGELACCQV